MKNIKPIAIVIAIFTQITSINAYAASYDISCTFDRLIQVHYEDASLTGALNIKQSLSIASLKTSDSTIQLDDKNRGAYSLTWIQLNQDKESYTSTFAGDYGELLTVNHALGETLKNLNGWYPASIVKSWKKVSFIRVGMCKFTLVSE